MEPHITFISHKGLIVDRLQKNAVFMGLLSGESLVVKFFIWNIGAIIIVNSQEG